MFRALGADHQVHRCLVERVGVLVGGTGVLVAVGGTGVLVAVGGLTMVKSVECVLSTLPATSVLWKVTVCAPGAVTLNGPL